MLIDSHCHLTDPAFDTDREAVLARMLSNGVTGAVVIESELSRVEATLKWAASTPGIVVATGCHPHDARLWDEQMAARLRTAWQHPLVRAAGEMGLDYHYMHSTARQQQQVLAAQLELAEAYQLPVVIHAREADADLLAVLQGVRVPLVLHSFSSSVELAEAGLQRDWYFSFSGMVTFKSWGLDPVIRQVANDRLLLETDAPYLAPVPWRGQRNEPSFLPATAARVAEVRGIPTAELACLSTSNARRLFWPDQSQPSTEAAA